MGIKGGVGNWESGKKITAKGTLKRSVKGGKNRGLETWNKGESRSEDYG